MICREQQVTAVEKLLYSSDPFPEFPIILYHDVYLFALGGQETRTADYIDWFLVCGG